MKRFKRIIVTISTLFAAAGLAACSTTGSVANGGESAALQPLRPISTCVKVNRIGEWYVVGPKTMIVRTGPKYYRIDMQAVCPQLGVGSDLSFRLGHALAGRLCGDMLDAVYTGEYPCPVQQVTAISEKQFRALEDSAP